MTEPIKAVIWDLDGTLINSVDHHWDAWRAVMAEERITLTFEDFVADFGKRNDEILRGRIDPQMSDAEVARIALSKEEKYRQSIRAKGLVLLPGAQHWLARLQAEGWRQALGTSAPRGNIDAVFDVLDIERFFDAVMSSEQVKAGKPEPDVFLAAAAAMNAPPERCIVIEDAPAGTEAARRAGMKSIGVLTTHEKLTADWVFRGLDELPSDFFNRLS
ncbi:MAG TPA: HAD-IA family hydrolase [Blastocatellia bacterium]|nr:HAD-IA family hydrolase [Blastocatellia bacterium]HMY73231.1 HAD-IA family hydrolase [Blastocatellia bacterium]HMZ20401.1 HAD-IA family hydrolase [Blastocatellia bacterium]HNG28115.1 HAD-IA family hydrolase [Blastocatellia bacterium]